MAVELRKAMRLTTPKMIGAWYARWHVQMSAS